MNSTTGFTLPNWLTSQHLTGMLRGIEKEGLRMQKDGYLAQTPHPEKLGSKLTHPYITTDYSESLLELITDPKESPKQALAMLRELHVLVQHSISDDNDENSKSNQELLWPLSMPCMLSSEDEDIPLADYGTSNIGKLKTLYRSGLGVRYGRRMQTIAGLHYNLSFGDDLFGEWHKQQNENRSLAEFKNEKYLGLIRNFNRLTSLVLYLYGASPSVCPCFLVGREHNLKKLNQHTYYQPNSTSLRMGKLGYTNSVQDGLDIRYNNLPEYIAGLRKAIHTPFKDFTDIGVDDSEGNPVQINDHILQIENEYYSPIRPKQIAKGGETPTQALEDRGIAYVEFRAIDLDPYSDVGIRLSSACFLEILALYCLLNDSPELMPDEDKELAINLERVVNGGRDTNTNILVNGKEQNLQAWMQKHLAKMLPLAEMFDEKHGGNDYRTAVALMQGKVSNPNLTLSAQIIADSKRLGSTAQLGKTLANQHKDHLLKYALSPNTQARYEVLAEKSALQQADLEAEQTQDFKEYVKQFR
ncbi:glutamate--cysteine ligase [Psychrobacter sp. HD31]|uniref:glutamate--cysteine ligase n=1 Tax=Psychrobacter sp. HD31 TaxID=3112003 RepID=UPI003DA63928